MHNFYMPILVPYIYIVSIIMQHFPIICLVSIKLNKVLISLCAVTQHVCMIGSMSDLQPSRPTIAFSLAHFLHEDLVMKTLPPLLLLQVGNICQFVVIQVYT